MHCAKLKFHACPKCAASMPFMPSRTSAHGEEIFVCPSCGTELRRAPAQRALWGILAMVPVDAVLLALPLWLAVPGLVVSTYFIARWMLALLPTTLASEGQSAG